MLITTNYVHVYELNLHPCRKKNTYWNPVLVCRFWRIGVRHPMFVALSFVSKYDSPVCFYET